MGQRGQLGAYGTQALRVQLAGHHASALIALRDQGAGVVSGELDAQRLSAVRAQLPALTHRVL